MPHSSRDSCGQGAAGTYLSPLPVARRERKGTKRELLVEDQTGLVPALGGYSSALVPSTEQPVDADPVAVAAVLGVGVCAGGARVSQPRPRATDSLTFTGHALRVGTVLMEIKVKLVESRRLSPSSEGVRGTR